MAEWVEVDGSNKVTAHRSSSDDTRPVPDPDLKEVVGGPPFIGGIYNPATKRVTNIPTPPPEPREILASKDPWNQDDRDEAGRLLSGK